MCRTANLGRRVGKKKSPPDLGGRGYFARKGNAKVRHPEGSFRAVLVGFGHAIQGLQGAFLGFFVPLRYGYFAGRR
jgi:hypothetical protein